MVTVELTDRPLYHVAVTRSGATYVLCIDGIQVAEDTSPYEIPDPNAPLTIGAAEGVEIGRRVWNLDNAIWTLQGRHRDMVRFPEFIYKVPLPGDWPQRMPGREHGEWKYLQVNGRTVDEQKFEEWKTKFYQLEGWDPESGWPTAATLWGVGLPKVAAELESRGKLGKG